MTPFTATPTAAAASLPMAYAFPAPQPPAAHVPLRAAGSAPAAAGNLGAAPLGSSAAQGLGLPGTELEWGASLLGDDAAYAPCAPCGPRPPQGGSSMAVENSDEWSLSPTATPGSPPHMLVAPVAMASPRQGALAAPSGSAPAVGARVSARRAQSKAVPRAADDEDDGGVAAPRGGMAAAGGRGVATGKALLVGKSPPDPTRCLASLFAVDASVCDPTFVREGRGGATEHTTARFEHKFCNHCRANGIAVLASRGEPPPAPPSSPSPPPSPPPPLPLP
jgi:hypothetical protein